jgi:hypothetical protein
MLSTSSPFGTLVCRTTAARRIAALDLMLSTSSPFGTLVCRTTAARRIAALDLGAGL